jgi:hypothetical protein
VALWLGSPCSSCQLGLTALSARTLSIRQSSRSQVQDQTFSFSRRERAFLSLLSTPSEAHPVVDDKHTDSSGIRMLSCSCWYTSSQHGVKKPVFPLT